MFASTFSKKKKNREIQSTRPGESETCAEKEEE